MLANYALTGKVVPVVNMFVNGPYIKFVTALASKRYITSLFGFVLLFSGCYY